MPAALPSSIHRLFSADNLAPNPRDPVLIWCSRCRAAHELNTDCAGRRAGR
jgi:hypothetical protein